MNNFECSLEKAKKLLEQDETVQEFFRLQKIVQNDSYLNQLDNEIHQHQKDMCANKNNDEIYFKEKSLYESKLAEFQSNPMVANYFEIKDEVSMLLNQMKEILQ